MSISIFRNGKRPSQEPHSSYFPICFTVVAIWNHFWSFTISSAASEPSSVFSPNHVADSIFDFLDYFADHVADVFGLFCQNHVADVFIDVDRGHENHSGELLLFVGCIVNFFVSYLICMFQDSVPAGSYNDPFLSSVCMFVCVYIYFYMMYVYN